MIVDIITSRENLAPLHGDWYYEGCICAASQHPPCSWCTSLTEEEVELYDSGGQESVIAFRKFGD